VYFAIVRLVGIGSIISCTIVIASFSLFAVNQTSAASTHQQQELKAEAGPSTGAPGAAPAPALARPQEGSVHKGIDEASEWLTSPFSGLTSGAHGEWAVHSIDLVLGLFVYGFCLGFLRRTIRVRI
jgi:hypothetical protein